MNLGPGVSIQSMQGPFDSQVVKASLGSLCAFPLFDNLVSRKRLVRERDSLRVKFGPRGGEYSVYTLCF